MERSPKHGAGGETKAPSSQNEPWVFTILVFLKQIHKGFDSQLLLVNASQPSWHFPRVMSADGEGRHTKTRQQLVSALELRLGHLESGEVHMSA